MAPGNGLRGDIWDGFRQRFNIETILEFYGATEGNIGLLNINGRVRDLEENCLSPVHGLSALLSLGGSVRTDPLLLATGGTIPLDQV